MFDLSSLDSLECRRLESGYRVDEIALIPDEPGFYAWYAFPRIYGSDIRRLKERLSVLSETERETAIQRFLEEEVFAGFRQTPYRVNLRGKLKPNYSGILNHEPSTSYSLVRRLAEDPDRLNILADLLAATTPRFSSPLYIGMATRSLRQRLLQHKELLLQYLESPPPTSISLLSQAESRDHSFAREAILERNFNLEVLRVHVHPVEHLGEFAVDVEHVLNRLYYPICGRN